LLLLLCLPCLPLLLCLRWLCSLVLLLLLHVLLRCSLLLLLTAGLLGLHHATGYGWAAHVLPVTYALLLLHSLCLYLSAVC
jgi:hypothetical protein